MSWPDVRSIIAVMTTSGAILLVGALVYLKSDQLNTAIGFFFGFWTGVGGFYFGSSSGSKDKDDVLGRIAVDSATKNEPDKRGPVTGGPR